jgi:hypothetical protein
MARRRREEANAIATQEITNGLEAIRSFGSEENDDLYISAEGNYFTESFAIRTIISSEDTHRFIKKVEMLVRSSREYKAYIGHLRSGLGMDHCSFLSGIDMSNGDITLEFHHCPLTLFDIVDIIIAHRLNCEKAITSLTIADEVLANHMENRVGILPLSRTVHKLVHSGSVIVHPAQVHGDWLRFLRAYSSGVDGDTVSKLLRFCSITENTMLTSTKKISASDCHPRLRADVVVPTKAEIRLLLG